MRFKNVYNYILIYKPDMSHKPLLLEQFHPDGLHIMMFNEYNSNISFEEKNNINNN